MVRKNLTNFTFTVALLTFVTQLMSCTKIAQKLSLNAYDSRIIKASTDFEEAADDAARARALSARGRAISDKARYMRTFKLSAREEFAMRFGDAMEDHRAAIRLDPKNAEVHFQEGRSIYDRILVLGLANEINLEPLSKNTEWIESLNLAEQSFSRALALNADHLEARDFRGLVRENRNDFRGAIADYELLMKSNPKLGSLRLAEVLCKRGMALQQAGKLQEAALDFERSLKTANPDQCSCNASLGLAAVKNAL